MEQINSFVNTLNGILFHDYVVYALLATGVLFTIWSGFGQYRALTHGISVIRGKYDKKDDPGAINHFQALSAALSATVGLGNIGGVATAVALGGPGAVFWMWIIGVLGMALKMTEVTQSMLYRNTDDPSNPHGGPMFVVKSLLAKQGGYLGVTIGGVFCLTLILSAVTGGNMFQAWNVANVTSKYFDIPGVSGIEVTETFNPETFTIGVVLAVIVGLVIVGGIKRIGAVAGRLVPFMCALYFLFGITVVIMNLPVIPQMIMLIISEGLGLSDSNPAGAFLGGSFGMAVSWGIKRALFSSEAGQGSAPIAHSAAKCDEPVREGVVAGLEPFIDTIVVCTITALVILSTNAWNRDAEAHFDETSVTLVQGGEGWTIEAGEIPPKEGDARTISLVKEGESGWSVNTKVYMALQPTEADRQWLDDNGHHAAAKNQVRIDGVLRAVEASDPPAFTIEWTPVEVTHRTDKHDEPLKDAEGNEIPIVYELASPGVYVDYPSANLTAHAFDRAFAGRSLFGISVGGWLITVASWLFAVSTMISWSYYGEQGIVYFFGSGGMGSRAVTAYRVIYAMLIAVSTLGFVTTDAQLDMWTTLGLGAMLVANIPIMWIFGAQAMRAYHEYIGKLKRGEFDLDADGRLLHPGPGDGPQD